jgi:hypothetical protein
VSTKDTARVGTSTDEGGFVSESARNRIGASAAQSPFRPTMTVLILGVCWWSLIELVLELGTGGGDTPQLGVVPAVRLAVIVSGLAAVADVRLARGVFFFLCAVSVLAIAPSLPLQFDRSFAVSLISLVECAGKAIVVLMSCASRPLTTAQPENRLPW